MAVAHAFEFIQTEDSKKKLSCAERTTFRCSDTPCLASPQPQMSYPRAGPPTPSLIHMVELEFVGL